MMEKEQIEGAKAQDSISRGLKPGDYFMGLMAQLKLCRFTRLLRGGVFHQAVQSRIDKGQDGKRAMVGLRGLPLVVHHPSDEDLSLHPIDEDLSLGTPNRRGPWKRSMNGAQLHVSWVGFDD